MIQPSPFDDIRPYYDEEVPAAIDRLVNSSFFIPFPYR